MSFTQFINEGKEVGDLKEYKFSKKDANFEFFKKFVFQYHDVYDEVQYQLKSEDGVITSKFQQKYVVYSTYCITAKGDVKILGYAVVPRKDDFATIRWSVSFGPKGKSTVDTSFLEKFDDAATAFNSIKKLGEVTPY